MTTDLQRVRKALRRMVEIHRKRLIGLDRHPLTQWPHGVQYGQWKALSKFSRTLRRIERQAATKKKRQEKKK